MRCEECGHDYGRRTKCRDCGKMVCVWCFGVKMKDRLFGLPRICASCSLHYPNMKLLGQGRINHSYHEVTTWVYGGMLIGGLIHRDGRIGGRREGFRRGRNPGTSELQYHGGNYDPN